MLRRPRFDDGPHGLPATAPCRRASVNCRVTVGVERHTLRHSALVDGGNNVGYVAVYRGTEIAIAKAKQTGIAEYSHAANAVVTFAALVCVVIAVLRQPSQAR